MSYQPHPAFMRPPRLRRIMEDPSQLLSNCVADHIVDQLQANGNRPDSGDSRLHERDISRAVEVIAARGESVVEQRHRRAVMPTCTESPHTGDVTS